ncbi:class I SAM-dependent methyltransferase, partial [Candidatus Woesearchaeota archaeon]|nr:class I SAM-dependent methyltransferase [Candidatus Woesearchaeota archaeon]
TAAKIYKLAVTAWRSVVDIEAIADQERTSISYAEKFFMEEKEMEGMFKIDTIILESIITKKGRILDAAMGPGRHVKYFAERGFEVWGNDFNAHMIEAARKYVGRGKARFTNHDMRNLSSIKSGYFDYVLCMGASIGSVYRRVEREKAMNEFARVVKKGGYVFIHAHNFFELTELGYAISILAAIKNRLLRPDKFELGDVVYCHSNSFNKAYMHWFMPDELRNLMRRAGLRVEREFYLKGPDQDEVLKSSFLKYFRSGGFIFVGRKR